jgi:hypothetical protein
MTEILDIAQSLSQASVAKSEGRISNYQEDANFARSEAEYAASESKYAAEEANRKTALADAIAAQRASAAGRGVAVFEGSPIAAMRETARRSGIESERSKEEMRREKDRLKFEKYGSETAKSAATYKAQQKASAYKAKAGISLLKTAGSYLT